MSMLAEPKRKQKWCLNPRGKYWSEDANKFGQKLLEKMGWSQGKGLGANEDGRTESIKVFYKNDSKGMGYKESDDQWTDHETNFTALLESLSGNKQKIEALKISSLEEKSQKSKARVHYKKFTRGKDLSRYSEKDLANIFGKKSLKEMNKLQKTLEIDQEPGERKNCDDIEKSSFLFNGGLISDYFKKKVPNFGKYNNSYVIGNNGVMKKEDSESESEIRPSLGLGFKQSKCDEKSVDEILENTSDESKTKSTFVSYLYEYNNKETSQEKKYNKKKWTSDENTNAGETPTKKKKKLELYKVREDTPVKKKKDNSKKRLEKDNSGSGLNNPAFDPMYSPMKVEKHVLDPIEESTFEDVSLNDSMSEVTQFFEVNVLIHDERALEKVSEDQGSKERSRKKKKKKKNLDEGISAIITDLSASDQIEDSKICSLNGNVGESSKSRKKKRSKDIEDGTKDSLSLSNLDGTINISSKEEKENKKCKEHCEGSPVDTKRKKSKIAVSEEGLDNPLFNMSAEMEECQTRQVENPFEIRIKKKKKNKEREENKFALENPVFNDESVDDNSRDVASQEFEVRRKHKSKKKNKKDGLDNPALNLDDTVEENGDIMLNIVTTPVVAKEQQKNVSEDSFRIHKIKGVKRRKSVRFSDVTNERIIPTNEEIQQMDVDDDRTEVIDIEGKLNDSHEVTPTKEAFRNKKRKRGFDNGAFDQRANDIEENITTISNTIDTYQAEIENGINEAKIQSVELSDIMVGEVGDPNGTNEKLPDGTVKLKFKEFMLGKSARYADGLVGPKKPYKHLIKGDIIVGFRETNLHEIEGYAVKENS